MYRRFRKQCVTQIPDRFQAHPAIWQNSGCCINSVAMPTSQSPNETRDSQKAGAIESHTSETKSKAHRNLWKYHHPNGVVDILLLISLTGGQQNPASDLHATARNYHWLSRLRNFPF